MSNFSAANAVPIQLGLIRLVRLLLALTLCCVGAAIAAPGPGGAAAGAAGGRGVFAPAPLLPPPPVPSPFDIPGFIHEASLDTAGAICQASDPRLAGGTFTVNNITVVVPCNT